jgi:hypothetical protein
MTTSGSVSMRQRLRQWTCGLLGGHARLRIYEPGRIALGCVCGWRSAGWTVGPMPSSPPSTHGTLRLVATNSARRIA